MTASVHSSSEPCHDIDLHLDVKCDMLGNIDSNNYDLLLSTLSTSSSCSSLSELQDSLQPLSTSSPPFTRRRKTSGYMTTTITTTTTTTTTTTSAPTTPVSPENTNASSYRRGISSDQGSISGSSSVTEQGLEDYCGHHVKPDDGEDDGYMSLLSLLSGFRLVSDGPYLFLFDVTISLYFPIRALILFALGFAFSLVIDHLQTQHHLIEYPSNIHQLWDTASWLPPTCGASAVLIGTIYPLGDYLWWGKRVNRNGRDWSSVMRCIGGFIGVNYAASKLPWTSSLQVSCTLALISVGLWFWFDRTVHGFVISLLVATMGTLVAYLLVLNGWYSFTRADFFGVGSWIPCILYSSSVCFGSIGRQLDVVPEAWYQQNSTVQSHHLKSE